MSLDIQWLTIAVMLMAGAGMGVLFDSYRVVSEYFKFPRWSLSLLDMLYWIVSAIAVFRLLYASNFGEVRGYVFIGLAIGVVLYAFIISSIYSKFVLVLIKFILRVIRLILNVIEFIVVKPIKILYKIGVLCIKIGTKITIRTIKIVLQLLLPIMKVLYWPIKPLFKPIFRFIGIKANTLIIPYLKKWTVLKQAKAITISWYKQIKNWIYS